MGEICQKVAESKDFNKHKPPGKPIQSNIGCAKLLLYASIFCAIVVVVISVVIKFAIFFVLLVPFVILGVSGVGL